MIRAKVVEKSLILNINLIFDQETRTVYIVQLYNSIRTFMTGSKLESAFMRQEIISIALLDSVTTGQAAADDTPIPVTSSTKIPFQGNALI